MGGIGNVTLNKEGEEKGIFFRSPIQKVYLDVFDCFLRKDDPIGKFYNSIKNPIIRTFQRIIGNGNVIDNIDEWLDKDDGSLAGIMINKLVSPIYFRRNYRDLMIISYNTKDPIQMIESKGYESGYESVAGECAVEVTRITFRNGKVVKLKRKGKYHFTYPHICEKAIATGNINVEV